jgi:2-iminobutanoate/2-iminopropanoate deaminase
MQFEIRSVAVFDGIAFLQGYTMRPISLAVVVALSMAIDSPRVYAQSPARSTVVPPGGSVTATLSPGIRIGDVLYVSGQLPRAVPGTRMLDSTIQEQTRTALENVKAVVEAAGSTMANVVKCTVFMTDVKEFQGMNSVYSTFWPKEPPARSTVVVAALVRADAKLEVECIAAIPK